MFWFFYLYNFLLLLANLFSVIFVGVLMFYLFVKNPRKKYLSKKWMMIMGILAILAMGIGWVFSLVDPQVMLE